MEPVKRPPCRLEEQDYAPLNNANNPPDYTEDKIKKAHGPLPDEDPLSAFDYKPLTSMSKVVCCVALSGIPISSKSKVWLLFVGPSILR
jgi:hypothetical protein